MSAFPRALRRGAVSDRRPGALTSAALCAALFGVLGSGAALPAAAAPATVPHVLPAGHEPTPPSGVQASSRLAGLSPGIIPTDPRQYVAFQLAMTGHVPVRDEHELRVASFQTGLSRSGPGQLLEELSEPGSRQAHQIAETIQRVRPDVLLLSGIDVDEDLQVAAALRTNYLAVGSDRAAGIDYPYAYAAPVNSGVDTGADLDDDGMIGGPGDAFGYGDFPGQGGMMVLSRVPLQEDQARTFQDFTWQDMPDSRLAGQDFSELEASVLRLSSASHWDIPVQVGGSTVHLLASAPADPRTAPGGADRHQDEIRFWTDYISGAAYPVDDHGTSGGLAPDSDFVVLGSLGADPRPASGEDAGAISALLELPQVQDTQPTSRGALLARDRQHTAVVPGADGGQTTARLDYVLPSSTLTTTGSGVFWPAAGQPGSSLVGPAPHQSGLTAQAGSSAPTDHRLVWVDITPGH